MKANRKLASTLVGGLLLAVGAVDKVSANEAEAAQASLIPHDEAMKEFVLVQQMKDRAEAVLGEGASSMDVQLAINGLDMHLKGLSDEVLAMINEKVPAVLSGDRKCMKLKPHGKNVVKACYLGGKAEKRIEVAALQTSIEARKANIAEQGKRIGVLDKRNSELAQEGEKLDRTLVEEKETIESQEAVIAVLKNSLASI